MYLKGLSCPLVEQETIVFDGASKLRDSSRRDIMAHYGMCRISQTYGTRHVGFDPAVEFTGRVTLEPLLEMPIGILQPILEEEEAEAGLVHLEPELGVEDMEVEPIREEDSTVDARPVTKAFKPISGIGAEDCFARRAVMEGISGSTELLSLSQMGQMNSPVLTSKFRIFPHYQT